VVEHAGVLADLEGPDRADHAGGRAAIGTAHKAVPLQAAEIPADGHLGDLELAGEAADLHRLVRRRPLQHLEAPLDR
jgi:hypothetical protein